MEATTFQRQWSRANCESNSSYLLIYFSTDKGSGLKTPTTTTQDTRHPRTIRPLKNRKCSTLTGDLLSTRTTSLSRCQTTFPPRIQVALPTTSTRTRSGTCPARARPSTTKKMSTPTTKRAQSETFLPKTTALRNSQTFKLSHPPRTDNDLNIFNLSK
jgi:hypothetical protein